MKIICNICKKEIGIDGIGMHLKKKHNIQSTKEYYDFYIKRENEEYCKICKAPVKYLNIKKGYSTLCEKCGKSNSLEVLSVKYGEDEGKKKFDSISKNKANTIEKFISKYGEEEGKKKFYKWKKSCPNTIEKFISKYGEEEGKKKFDKWKENTGIGATLNGYIKNFGEEEGRKRYNNKCEKMKFSKSDKGYIKKYGKDGLIIKKQHKENTSISKEKFIERYGKISGVEKFYKMLEKRNVKLLKASKKSLNIFFPLIDYILENNICKFDDIYLGISGSSEYFLSTKRNIYFYDFCIPKLKCIIEFHGIKFHYHGSYKDEWKPLYNLTKEICIEKEYKKAKVAYNRNFSLLEIWEHDTEEFNFNISKNFVNICYKYNILDKGL